MSRAPSMRPRPAGKGPDADELPSPRSAQGLLSDHGKLPREGRVRHRREFIRIQGKGLRVHTMAFSVVALRGDRTDRPRIGCSVSKRVGNAVVRSRVRRLIRETFRRLAHRLSAVDFVVIAKPQAHTLAKRGLDAVVSELVPALMKANQRVERKST